MLRLASIANNLQWTSRHSAAINHLTSLVLLSLVLQAILRVAKNTTKNMHLRHRERSASQSDQSLPFILYPQYEFRIAIVYSPFFGQLDSSATGLSSRHSQAAEGRATMCETCRNIYLCNHPGPSQISYCSTVLASPDVDPTSCPSKASDRPVRREFCCSLDCCAAVLNRAKMECDGARRELEVAKSSWKGGKVGAMKAEQAFWEKFQEMRREQDVHGKEGRCTRRRAKDVLMEEEDGEEEESWSGRAV